MLRVPEPRPREAGAAGQSKPLTSFFIQDILRDGAERRGGHTGSPQPPCQPDARRELEPEPEGGRGGAGAPEDEWGARPRAAQEADKPAASEPGEAAGLGQGAVPQEGRAGLGAARAGPRRGGRSPGCRDAGPRGDRPRDPTASRRGRASEINPEPGRPSGAGFLHGLDSPGTALSAPRALAPRAPLRARAPRPQPQSPR